MLEFVTVKDNLLEFLRKHQAEVIDSEIINNDFSFFYKPNGVVQACIEEMVAEKVIIVHQNGTKAILIIADSGKNLLNEGGYKKKFIEDKKLPAKFDSDSVISQTIKSQNIRKKQMSILSNLFNVPSTLSSILFKRI